MGILTLENEPEEHLVAIAQDANQRAHSNQSLLRETPRISDQGLVAESISLDERHISATLREKTHVEVFFNPTSSEGLCNQHVESTHHTLYPWHAPTSANIGLHDVPQGVSKYDFPNDGHKMEQPGSVAGENNSSHHDRQGMPVNGDFFTASNMTNVFPQTTDGPQMRFTNFLNTTETFPLAIETQTVDGEKWDAPVTLHQPFTHQPQNPAYYDDLQRYIAYDMNHLHIGPRAGLRETLANAAELPGWMYKKPDQPVQDPFTVFPRTDSLLGNVDIHSWRTA